MTDASLPALAFVAFIVAQRLGELWLARRNTAHLLARGAHEVGAAHYPMMVTLHASWVAALIVFGYDKVVSLPWLLVFGVLQVFRVWVLTSLGERWTTRIVVLDAPLVRHGPFRFMRHPNYAVVTGEIAVAPMVLLAVGTDCSVGKMYTALALEKAMRARGMKADFRATGQTGATTRRHDRQPLVLGLVWVALAFTILNAAMLSVRIRAENDALADWRGVRSNP